MMLTRFVKKGSLLLVLSLVFVSSFLSAAQQKYRILILYMNCIRQQTCTIF